MYICDQPHGQVWSEDILEKKMPNTGSIPTVSVKDRRVNWREKALFVDCEVPKMCKSWNNPNPTDKQWSNLIIAVSTHADDLFQVYTKKQPLIHLQMAISQISLINSQISVDSLSTNSIFIFMSDNYSYWKSFNKLLNNE